MRPARLLRAERMETHHPCLDRDIENMLLRTQDPDGAAVTAADHVKSLRQVLVQYERAMTELGWTMVHVRPKDFLDALQAQAEEGANWKASCARYLAARQAAEAERDGAIKEAAKTQNHIKAEIQHRKLVEAERDRLRLEVGEALGEAFLLLSGIDYEEESRIDRAVDALERARAALAGEDTRPTVSDWIANHPDLPDYLAGEDDVLPSGRHISVFDTEDGDDT